jgi:hypothetical protein
MKGVMFPVVAKKIKDRSNPEISRTLAYRIVRESLANISSGGSSIGFAAVAVSLPGCPPGPGFPFNM